MDLIIYLKPDSILDIGVGFGKYGVLCREYLELWDGRGRYSEFIRRIDGVEAFQNYITPLHRFVYSNIYVDDALDLIDKLDFNYDLVLLIDVLEHFKKEDGQLLLNKILRKNKALLVSTPKKVSDQKDAFNNTYEIHQSQWTKHELSLLGNSFFVQDNISYIAYIARNIELVNRVRKDFFRRKVKRIPGTAFIIKSYRRLMAKYKTVALKTWS
jgi:hypothetical protein